METKNEDVAFMDETFEDMKMEEYYEKKYGTCFNCRMPRVLIRRMNASQRGMEEALLRPGEKDYQSATTANIIGVCQNKQCHCFIDIARLQNWARVKFF